MNLNKVDYLQIIVMFYSHFDGAHSHQQWLMEVWRCLQESYTPKELCFGLSYQFVLNFHLKYVTLHHKTSHKCQFFPIQIYASSKSWINKLSIDVPHTAAITTAWLHSRRVFYFSSNSSTQLELGNIWLRYNYLKNIAFKVVQMKF